MPFVISFKSVDAGGVTGDDVWELETAASAWSELQSLRKSAREDGTAINELTILDPGGERLSEAQLVQLAASATKTKDDDA
jgi:hypothetical protein